MIFDLAECEEIACHSFRDKQILRTAFTHTSYANEHRTESYERLEYLGDALLDFLVAEHLYRTYPKMEEGEMTTLRAKLVSKPALKQIAQDLNLGRLVLLGEGGNKSGERNNDKILSSLIESLLAAVYLDGGMEAAALFVKRRVLPESDKVFAKVTDHKTELQEYVQKRKLGAILYTEKGRSGPDHSPVFLVAVSVKGKELAVGKGGKKQAAEQEAAKLALAALQGAPTKGESFAPAGNNPQKAAKPNKAKAENPVLSLVENYGESKGENPPKKAKSPKGEPKQNKLHKKEAKPVKNAEPQPVVKESQPSVKEKRAFRERPMPKNKPEKKKSFSEFAGGVVTAEPVKKEKPPKAKKPLFSRKSKGGDGTPL